MAAAWAAVIRTGGSCAVIWLAELLCTIQVLHMPPCVSSWLRDCHRPTDLESLFIGDEVRRELPEATQRFAGIDGELGLVVAAGSMQRRFGCGHCLSMLFRRAAAFFKSLVLLCPSKTEKKYCGDEKMCKILTGVSVDVQPLCALCCSTLWWRATV